MSTKLEPRPWTKTRGAYFEKKQVCVNNLKVHTMTVPQANFGEIQIQNIKSLFHFKHNHFNVQQVYFKKRSYRSTSLSLYELHPLAYYLLNSRFHAVFIIEHTPTD